MTASRLSKSLLDCSFKGIHFNSPWTAQRGWFEKRRILTKVATRRNKKGLFLAFTLVLSNSSLSLHLPVSLRLWSRQDVGKPLTCLPLPLPSILPLPTSLFSSLYFPSRGAAFRSELMDLRWCMHSSSRIPSSMERRAVSKKKDDMWD